jgi:tripartite-type tricarboxylate transporter receptor subunit TctC
MHHALTRTLACVVLATAFANALPAIGQQYPSKPIRFIVPFAPGGGTDLLGRTLAQKLNEAWGQPVVVDNRAGGGGNIGTDIVAKSPPDGYTLLMGYVGNLAINPYLFKTLPYDSMKDFAPVTLAATAPNVFVAHPAVAAKTVKEVIALAKAKPGALNYASAGNGTVGHMVAELFKTVTQVNIVHIPYKGNGQAIAEILGGNVQLMFSAPATVIHHIKSGKLRGLAVASAKRVNGLEDVPTFAEAGYPAVEATAWYGVLAPANTPRPIVTRLHGELARILQLTEVRERLATAGYDAVSCTPEEFARLIRSDLAKWEKVVKASGARVD